MKFFNNNNNDDFIEKVANSLNEQEQIKREQMTEEEKEQERLIQERLQLKEQRKEVRTKNLIYSCRFQSGSKTMVNVFKNRIEFMHTSLSAVAFKGISGRFIIYLNKLSAIELTSGRIEFMVEGMNHHSGEINKMEYDNVITFNVRELELAEELIDVINDLI